MEEKSFRTNCQREEKKQKTKTVNKLQFYLNPNFTQEANMYRTARRINRPTETLEVAASWLWLWGSTFIGLIILLGLWSGVFWLISLRWENGYTIGYYASIIGLAIAVLGYLFSEPLVVFMTKAERLPDDHELTQLVNEVAKKAHIRCPRVYLIPDSSPNAFATGIKLPIPFLGGRGAVGFTQGIVDMMDEEELKGITGHELSHLKSGDLILATMASALIMAVSIVLRVIVRWPQLLGNVHIGGGSSSRSSRSSSSSSSDSKSSAGAGCGAIFLAILKFIMGILIVLGIILAIFLVTQVVMPLLRAWINRTREFWADAGSAEILGSPDPLIHALEKLDCRNTTINGVGHFAGAFFNVPAVEQQDFLDKLFATHPDTEKRIDALNRRADGQFNLL
jgi:heat shock protein HtpX